MTEQRYACWPVLILWLGAPSVCQAFCFSPPSSAVVAPSALHVGSGADECSLLEDEDGVVQPVSECLSAAGYERDTWSRHMLVSEVYVAPVESLRDSFPSFESTESDEGSNLVKFLHRKHRGGLHPIHQQQAPTQNQIEESATNGSSSSLPNTESQNGSSNAAEVEMEDDHRPTHVANIEYNDLVSDDEVVLVDVRRRPGMQSVSRAFLKAGPRKHLHFDPTTVNAAICVAGGLCPGLNNVVRELVHALYYLYGVKQVYGITGGFHGFYQHDDYPPVLLTNELVADIHHEGGTVLRSARGGFDEEKILAFLEEHDIQQLYVIGGDGTHRGAYAIHQACQARDLNVAVVGIPKTIDNDVDYIGRSFGFASAVEAAQQGLRTAVTEAKCNVPNGIGIIKLMGRSAGFLASFAALGSGEVDLVLVPEVDIVLDGPDGILPFLRRRIREQKYAVVVVAEGAGEELLGQSTVMDAGGNRARPPIGEFLQQQIQAYFAQHNEVATIKYIDPSYMVRSVPANGADALYCLQLAQNAVHGAMAGLTGFSVGLVNKNCVYLPIPLLVASSPRSLNPYGTTWERILSMTGQPNTAGPREQYKDASATNEADMEFPNLEEPSIH